MRSPILLLLCLAAPTLMAAPPQKYPLQKYASLWLNSPFTTKPVVTDTAVAKDNPLNDWALGGITKFPDGWFVVLLNKKNPEERKLILPSGQSDFKVVQVVEDPEDYRKTKVTLSADGQQGEVSYDEKLLTIKTAPTAPANPAAGQNIQPPNPAGNGNNPTAAPVPGQAPGNANGIAPIRPPRLRTIIPPQNKK